MADPITPSGQLVLPGLESIRRPDGRLYRPRKITGHALADDEDFVTGVLILGTHDVGRAQVLADECAVAWVDRGFKAVRPETGWYRDGFEYGRRCWVSDEQRGRAGVLFRDIVEAGSE